MTPTRDNAQPLGPGAVVSHALAGGAYVAHDTTRTASVQATTLQCTGGRL